MTPLSDFLAIVNFDVAIALNKICHQYRQLSQTNLIKNLAHLN